MLESEATHILSSFSEVSLGWRDIASESIDNYFSFFLGLDVDITVSTFFAGLLWEVEEFTAFEFCLWLFDFWFCFEAFFTEVSTALLWREGLGVLGFWGVGVSFVFIVYLFEFLLLVCKLEVQLFESETLLLK